MEAVTKDGPKDVFDYHDQDVAKHVLQKYPDISYIFDTIGSPASSASVAQLFGERGGRLCTVRPGKAHCDGLHDKISVHDVFVFTVFPKEHDYRGKSKWAVSLLGQSPHQSVEVVNSHQQIY